MFKFFTKTLEKDFQVILEENKRLKEENQKLFKRIRIKGYIHTVAFELQEKYHKHVIKKIEIITKNDINQLVLQSKTNKSIVLISKYNNEDLFYGLEKLIMIENGLKRHLTQDCSLVLLNETECKICYNDFTSNDYIKFCQKCSSCFCTKCYLKLMYSNIYNTEIYCMKCPYCTFENKFNCKVISDKNITKHIEKELYRESITKCDANDIVKFINELESEM